LFAKDAYVIQFKSLEESKIGEYPLLEDFFKEHPYLSERYVIMDTNEPNVWYFMLNKKMYPSFDYFFRHDTKISIEEAKKKVPQLFI
jgi:hypothetical protein